MEFSRLLVFGFNVHSVPTNPNSCVFWWTSRQCEAQSQLKTIEFDERHSLHVFGRILRSICDPYGCSKKLKDCMPLLRCCLFPNIAWFAAIAIQAVENQTPLRQRACQKSIRKHVSFSSRKQIDSCLLSLRIGAPLLTSPHPWSILVAWRNGFCGRCHRGWPVSMDAQDGNRWRPGLACQFAHIQFGRLSRHLSHTWMGIMAAMIFRGMRT